MFVEANVDQAVEWTKPQDIMFDLDDPTFGLGDIFVGLGFHVAMADGSARFIENCISPERTANLILKDDGAGSLYPLQQCEAGIVARVAESSVSYDGSEQAPDKAPLLPGQTATFENYTSFVDGITFLNFDIGRLPSPVSIGADDFVLRVGNGNESSDFSDLGIVPTVTVGAGEGASESDRVTLEFPAGTITNTWLQITLLASDNTGLAANSTFYFGNAIGETGNDPSNAIVNLADVALARQNQTGFGTAGIESHYDIDRDGRVNLVDVALIRQNQSGFTPLNLITAPGGSSSRGLGNGNSKGGGTGGPSFLPRGIHGLRADDLSDLKGLDFELGLLAGQSDFAEGLKDEMVVEPVFLARFDQELRLSGVVERQEIGNDLIDQTFSELRLNQVEEAGQILDETDFEMKLVAVLEVGSAEG